MVKIVYLVTKRPDLTDKQFVDHWTSTHADLATQLPELQAYSINLPSPEQRGPRPIDGYAMVKFPSWTQAKAAWASEIGRATAADGELFMAGTRAAIVNERQFL